LKAESAMIDEVVTDLFRAFRLEYKKLIKTDFTAVKPGLSQLHFLIMRTIAGSQGVPVSEIGKELHVPGPQMTHLTDQLIDFGMVVRKRDSEDRRVTRIALTDTGKIALARCRSILRDNIRRKLSGLKDDDLKDLAILLHRLGNILSGLD
jgi:DNA-binding MarR family transcriptional regulator